MAVTAEDGPRAGVGHTSVIAATAEDLSDGCNSRGCNSPNVGCHSERVSDGALQPLLRKQMLLLAAVMAAVTAVTMTTHILIIIVTTHYPAATSSLGTSTSPVPAPTPPPGDTTTL